MTAAIVMGCGAAPPPAQLRRAPAVAAGKAEGSAAARPAAPAEPVVPRIEIAGLDDGAIVDFDLRGDGRLLAVARGDRVELWDVATGTLRSSTRWARAVTRIAFAPDGATVMVNSVDKGAKDMTGSGTKAASDRMADAASASAALGEKEISDVAVPAEYPKLTPLAPAAERANGSTGIRHLSAEHRATLQKWIVRVGGVLKATDDTTWLAAAEPRTDASPTFEVSPDGLIVSAKRDIASAKRDLRTSSARAVEPDEVVDYLRLDTRAEWSVKPWTTAFAHEERWPGHIETTFGPSPDVVLVESVARQGNWCEVGTGKLYDSRSGKLVAQLGSTCQPAEWSPRGDVLLLSDTSGRNYHAHDTTTGKDLFHFQTGSRHVISDNGRLIAIFGGGGVVVRDLRAGGRPMVEVISGGRGEGPIGMPLVVGSNGRSIVALGAGDVALWDLANGRHEQLLDEPLADQDRFSWDDSANVFAVATEVDVSIIDAAARKKVRSIPLSFGASTIAVRPDGKAIALCGERLMLMPLPDGKPLQLSRSSRKDWSCPAIAWSSDSRLLAAASTPTGNVDVFDATTGVRLRRALAGMDRWSEEDSVVFDGLAFRPGSHALFIDRTGSTPLGPEREEADVERHVLVVDADTGAVEKSAIEEAQTVPWTFARDGSAVLSWTTDSAGLTALVAYDVRSGEPTKASYPANPALAPSSYVAAIHPFDLARTFPNMEAVTRFARPGADDEAFVAALAPDASFSASLTTRGLRLVRRSDGASITLFAATVGRTGISVVTDDQGHFDADAASLPFVRARVGDTLIDSGPALEAQRRPGMLPAFLAAAK